MTINKTLEDLLPIIKKYRRLGIKEIKLADLHVIFLDGQGSSSQSEIVSFPKEIKITSKVRKAAQAIEREEQDTNELLDEMEMRATQLVESPEDFERNAIEDILNEE